MWIKRQITRFVFCLGAAFVAAAASPAAKAQFAPPAKAQDATVNVLGWADYIAPQVMEAFAKETGVRIVYDVFESEAALETRLAEAKGLYDLVTPPAHLLPKMIAAGQLARIDHAAVPAARDLWPEIGAKLAAFDPTGQYALAHIWFAYGLAYDRKLAAERMPETSMGSWETLFRPDTLKKFTNCGVRLPDDADLMLEVSQIALRVAPGLRSQAEISAAGALAAKLRGNVSEFRSGGAAALGDGEICLALLPAGEAALARERGKIADPPRDIGFVLPKEGAPLSIDALVQLKDAPHPVEAGRFMAFLQRPEIAARNAAAAQLASGVQAAKALLGGPAQADKFVWLEDDAIRRLTMLPLPDPALRKAIGREWLKVKTGSYEPALAPAPVPAKKARPGAKDAAAPATPGDKPGIVPKLPGKKPPGRKPKRPGHRAEG